MFKGIITIITHLNNDSIDKKEKNVLTIVDSTYDPSFMCSHGLLKLLVIDIYKEIITNFNFDSYLVIIV